MKRTRSDPTPAAPTESVSQLALGARRRNYLLDFLAFFSGCSLTLAFAPFEIRAFAVSAPALIFWLWWLDSPGRAAWRGWLFGAGLFGTGIYWIYYSLHLFGDAVAPLAALLTLLFVFGMALYFALLGYLLAKLRDRHNRAFWLLFAAPAAWVLAEWVRSWFLTGFPWLLLGYTQVDTLLAGYAPLAGVYGLSWLTALTATLILFFLSCRTIQARTLVVMFISIIWCGGYLVSQIEWTESEEKPLRVSLIQGNVAQHQKFLQSLLVPSLTSYAQLSLEQDSVDVIIWPETAVPAYYHQVEDLLTPLVEQLNAQGTEVLTGIFTYDQQNKEHFNALLKLGEDPQVYRKRHLVPFAEYMPFRSLFAFLSRFILIPMSDLTAGDAKQEMLELAGHPVAASICYEVAFGAQIISTLPEATVLVNVSNDGWFGDSLAPHQHLEIARMRSLETGRPMLRATNTGVSALIDYDGQVLRTAAQFQQTSLQGQVLPRHGATPYILWGDLPITACAVLIMAWASSSTTGRLSLKRGDQTD